jgi:hypothetical protein
MINFYLLSYSLPIASVENISLIFLSCNADVDKYFAPYLAANSLASSGLTSKSYLSHLFPINIV